jgi:hypothetical protein
MAGVRKIAGENLSDSELEEMANKLMKRARSIRAERYGMSADQAVDAAIKAMSEEAVTQGQLRTRGVYLNNQAFVRELGKIQTAWGDNPRDGLVANYVGSNILRQGAQRSIHADQRGLADKWVNGFASDMERTGKMDMWAKGDLDEDVYKALGEEYKDNPNYTGIDRDARDLSAIIFKYQELFRVSANNAGAMIGKLADYITHQSHDQFKVRTASGVIEGTRGKIREALRYNEDLNFKAWRDFVMPKLDGERTFMGLEDPDKWLRHVWQSIASGEHLNGASSNSGFIAQSSMAGKMSEPRLLHFKDAQARYDYDSKFGRGGSLVERVILQLNQGAHNVALMTRMGPNPEQTHNRLKTAARLLTEQSVSARLASKWSTDERYIDAMWRQVTGEANTPGTDPFSTALRTVRSIQVLSKLGGAVISSISDTAVAASELNYQGFSPLEAWGAQLDGVLQGYGKRGQQHAERLRMASELGVAVDYLRASTWSRFSADDGMPGWQAKMQHLFYKINGLQWWTDTLRMANAQAMSHRIALNADRTLVELDSGLQRMFKLFDIRSDEWELMRGRAVDVSEGKEFFSPNGASRITDVEIAHLLQKENTRPTQRRVAERRNEIETKFRSFFAARADYAVIVPGPRTSGIMSGDTAGARPGSITSELFRSVFQFKGFPMAIVEKVFGREFFGYGESGKYGDATGKGMSKLAGFMVYSTLLGATALYLKAYLGGRRLDVPQTPKDAASLFLASFVQGGGAGLYGDFLFGQARDRYGHSALEALAGPTVGLAADAYSGLRSAEASPFDAMWGKAKQGDKNAGAAFFAVKNNLPFINLFYTRMALDYLFLYRIQEYMSPGSLARTEKNYKENLHQTFKLPPKSNYRIEERSAEDIGKLLNPL